MRLQFDEEKISEIAERYQYRVADDGIVKMSDDIRARRFLKKEELFEVAHWKSPRSAQKVYRNTDDYVEEVTKLSFEAKTERVRIEILTTLDGVGWPTASVILHLFHEDLYPILDFRALWSVGESVPKQYNFNFWWLYVELCREIAGRNDIDMRILDKALWQYSNENQK